ncbi:MAG: NUDIX domain-containing protein [Gammaproteobacteria bacterium]
MSALRGPFVHCPACARGSDCVDTRVFLCEHCAFRYYHNVAAAVAAFIVHDGELLLTRRAHAPAAGTLDLPGGFVDPAETLEAALARELAEELGLAPLPATPRYLFSVPNVYEYAGVSYATADAFFLIACATRPALAALDDVSETLWRPVGAIEIEEIGLASAREAMQKFQSL